MTEDLRISALKQALQLYLQEYGQPESVQQLEGIIGSLITVQQQLEGQWLQAKETTAVVRRVAQEFTAGGAEAVLDDLQTAAKRSLVQAARHRWQTLENKARSVLNAYGQAAASSFTGAAGVEVDQVRAMATAVVPIVADGDINRAEALGLVDRLIQTFELPQFLAAETDPTILKLAKRLALALGQRPLESLVESALATYREKYAPDLESFGFGLIGRIVDAAIEGRVGLDWDVELDLEAKQVLIQQVAFRANILEASPPPSKTAAEIAAQINQEVEQFRDAQAKALGGVNETAGIFSHDGLEISSPWDFSNGSEAKPPQL